MLHQGLSQGHEVYVDGISRCAGQRVRRSENVIPVPGVQSHAFELPVDINTPHARGDRERFFKRVKLLGTTRFLRPAQHFAAFQKFSKVRALLHLIFVDALENISCQRICAGKRNVGRP